MSFRILSSSLLALAAVTAPVAAQRPVFLGLSGGVSIPTGRFADGASVGWHGLAILGVSTFMQPLGLRLDVAHSRFTAKSTGPDQALSSATLNFTYRLPMTNSAASPFLITGAGAYRLECTGSVDCGSSTRFGWNAGLGFKIATIGQLWLLESRFHSVNASRGSVRYIPVTFGLLF